ncbi:MULTISPECIES: ABC transporter permease [Thermomonospora]|uniref:Transport permease protein n=1 Tax=Thermomonospora cellulosilytica TaxID=1411118 RepID=A0A7W3N173_9ACTN|nr:MULTISPECIES: ABC transporter permease [Thermomonospora]MBA9005648.1 ABC-2 type transport system permease protein [Thermomonospora cellulosilytica]
MTTSTRTSAEIVRVRVPERSVRHDLRAVKIVFHRELLRFAADRMRIVSGLVQPVLWLLVLGTGLSSLTAAGGGEVDLRTFIYPGVCAMTVMFTAMFSAASIVWDREFGFLREMLVAPVSRGAIVLGKVLGGASVATAQGLVIVALGGLVGVPYHPALMLTLVAELFLGAFALTALGVMLAARISTMQSFFAVVQMAMMPMLFLSGALYPLTGLPSWLNVLIKLNPLTYAVDPMRQAVFGRLELPPELERTFNSGITWNGWPVPVWLELVMVAGIGLVLLAVAIARFRRGD